MFWKRVCAWCDDGLGYLDAKDNDEYKITHGICHNCVKFIKANKPKALHEFIQRFKMPLLVIDRESRVCSANKASMVTLNKPLCEIEGKLGGNVIECVNARKPGGCGKSEHCTGCTIRRCVTKTFKTGNGVEKETATQDITVANGQTKKMKFVITTEKVSETVLLRFDSVEPAKSCH